MRRLIPLILMLVGGAHASTGELTETEAVRRGMTRPDILALLEARRGVAAGNVLAAGRWANPEIEYSEETLDARDGESEERFLWIRQRLNLAGVHGLERGAAKSQQVADDARTEWAAREIASDIRTAFYEALAAEDQAAISRRWHARLAELTNAVERRAAAGEASRYDALRLNRELALAAGEALAAEARAASTRDRLFSLIGGEPVPIAGALPPPAVAIAGGVTLTDHPLVQGLAAEARSAELSAKAAHRAAWPEVTVGVGRRELSERGFETDGHAISLAVEIPIFDRGTGRAHANASRAHQLRVESTLAQARLAAEMRAAQRLVAARREAALTLLPAATGTKSELVEIAEAAYAGGEITIVELLDAYRTERSAREEFIERGLAAREAYIQLQMLNGDQP